jgi:hypothetical protein
MSFAFRSYDDKLAIWEKPTSGDVMAPFDDPLANMDKVKFHSDLQYLSSQAVSADININHTSLAGVTGTGYVAGSGGGPSSGSSTPIANGQVRVSSIDLATHSLGYVPLFYVLYNDRIVSPGTIVQTGTNMARFVSVYATTTKIILREVAISSSSALPAITKTYNTIVFREPIADPAKPMLRLSANHPMVLARGKVTEADRPLRKAASADAKFYIPTERTLDICNGAIRTISPLDGIVDVGTNYNGGFTSAESILVTF